MILWAISIQRRRPADGAGPIAFTIVEGTALATDSSLDSSVLSVDRACMMTSRPKPWLSRFGAKMARSIYERSLPGGVFDALGDDELVVRQLPDNRPHLSLQKPDGTKPAVAVGNLITSVEYRDAAAQGSELPARSPRSTSRGRQSRSLRRPGDLGRTSCRSSSGSSSTTFSPAFRASCSSRAS